jgi:hypothetical protein
VQRINNKDKSDFHSSSSSMPLLKTEYYKDATQLAKSVIAIRANVDKQKVLLLGVKITNFDLSYCTKQRSEMEVHHFNKRSRFKKKL